MKRYFGPHYAMVLSVSWWGGGQGGSRLMMDKDSLQNAHEDFMRENNVLSRQ